MNQRRLAPSTIQKSLVWLLLVAIALLGLTITQQQALGSLHKHFGLESRTTVVVAVVASLASDWKGRWQQQNIRGHGQLVLGTASNAMDWPPVAPRSAHGHDHDALERHHHAAGDETVVALDGAAQRVEAVDGSNTASSIVLPIVGTPGNALTLQAIASDAGAWPTPGFAALVSRAIPPPLRPPTV